MESNYINENFYAYASVFMEGFNNIKVFNFLTKNVGTGQPDINLRLNEQEAKEITYQLGNNKNLHATLKGALNADLLLHLSSDTWNTPDFILDDVKHLFESKNIFEYLSQENIIIIRRELVKTILERWPDDWEKGDYNIRDNCNSIKRLMENIISLYPDIFRECFDDLTEVHKCVLIASALGTSHLRTTSDIKQYIKENIQNIILFIKSTLIGFIYCRTNYSLTASLLHLAIFLLP